MSRRFYVFLTAVLLSVTAAAHALDFKLDGDVRSRYCYMINKDGDFVREADFGIWDARGRLGIKIETENGFYGYYRLEIGNIAFGEPYMGGAQSADGVNVETKNLFVGYKNDFDPLSLAGKIGIFSFQTPLAGEIDDDVAGAKLNLDFLGINIELMYSKLYTGMSNTNMSIDMNDFEIRAWDATHLYYAQAGYTLDLEAIQLKNSIDVYYMRLNDNRFTHKSRLNWLGVYESLKFSIFELEGGVSINGGDMYITNDAIHLNAMYAKAKLKVDLFGILDIFGRIHYATGNAQGETNVVRQFQTIGGRGDFDSDLAILFGGSPFSQQAYFDYRYVGLDTRRNITQGRIRFTDPGLFVIEAGAQKTFDSIGLRTRIVFGMAMTANSVTNSLGEDVTSLGYEFDLNNRLKLAKGTYLTFNAAMLLHGNALRSVYAMSTDVQTIDLVTGTTNSSTVLIGGEPTIKLDAEIQIEI